MTKRAAEHYLESPAFQSAANFVQFVQSLDVDLVRAPVPSTYSPKSRDLTGQSLGRDAFRGSSHARPVLPDAVMKPFNPRGDLARPKEIEKEDSTHIQSRAYLLEQRE